MQNNTPTLTAILDMNSSSLFEARTCLPNDSLLRAYAEFLYAYMKVDTLGMRQSLSMIAESKVEESDQISEQTIALAVADLRLAIRTQTIERESIDQLLHLEIKDPAWRAEVIGVAAMAFSKLGENAKSQDHYQLAMPLFEELGARRKSLRCLMNYFVAESRIHPEKNLLVDYLHIAQRAASINDNEIAGLAQLHISREHKKTGALAVALEHCDQAIELMKEESGSIHFDHAILHRAQLLLDLNRHHEAMIEIERARTSGFTETQSALKVLEGLASEQARVAIGQNENVAKLLSPMWRERLEGNNKGQNLAINLTPSESQVLNFITEKPRDKFEIISYLYSGESGSELLEDRLKNILMRLRKKLPGFILVDQGKYRIADEVFHRRINDRDTQRQP